MPAQRKILFATDYSELTDEVLTHAASLARERGATLLVAHVSQLEQYPVGELFDEEPQPSDEELAELKAVRPPDPRIACEHRLLYGDPAEQIVKLADEEHAEAIVIGMHKHTRLLRLLGGSVAEKVLQAAHCPVITYQMSRQVLAGRDGEATAGVESDGAGQAARASAARRRNRAAEADLQRTVREWIAHRYQLCSVFGKHGIDVFWDGDKSLADVCRERGLNPRHLADELAEALRPTYRETGTDWYQASITELCNHIETAHHDYLRRELPRLGALLAQTAQAYQAEHPELDEVRAIFDRFGDQLMEHVEAESGVLFPALRRLDAGEIPQEEGLLDPGDFISRMKEDHDFIGTTLLQVRRLTNGYSAPAGAPTAYRALLGGLWALEANLHLNVHEEDEVLFPKVMAR